MEKVFLILSAILFGAFCISYFFFKEPVVPFVYEYQNKPNNFKRIENSNIEDSSIVTEDGFYPMVGDLVYIDSYIRKIDEINPQRNKVSYINGKITCIVNINNVKPLPGMIYKNGYILPIEYKKNQMLMLDWDDDYDRKLSWENRDNYSK